MPTDMTPRIRRIFQKRIAKKNLPAGTRIRFVIGASNVILDHKIPPGHTGKIIATLQAILTKTP